MPLSTLPLTATSAARLAGAVTALEAAVLFVVSGTYLVELVSGRASEPGIAGMSLSVTLVFAILLAAMAHAWLTGRHWPRTPTIVWNLLLLPAAWTLAGTESPLIGLGTAAVAVLAIVGALAAPAPDLTDKAL